MLPYKKDQVIQEELDFIREQIAAHIALSYPKEVQAALCYLHDHFFEESCNVNTVVECSGAPKSGIHMRFKYHVSKTIRCYLEDLRMIAAMRLLWYDELEIFVIAFSIGYANYRTFERAFRRYVGCYPREYREKMSTENVHRFFVKSCMIIVETRVLL